VLTFALGIGAKTAIFTLINAVVLRALPVQHPERLVIVGNPARFYPVHPKRFSHRIPSMPFVELLFPRPLADAPKSCDFVRGANA